MAPVKAWYWTALGILVLTLGTSDTVRCWAGKGSQVLDDLYMRGRAYVAVAHILLDNPSATDSQLQGQVARAQAVQDRFRAQQDIAQAQIARAQALVEERVIRQQELLMNKAMRGDRAMRIVRGERIVIPGRVLVGPEGVIVNGRHRIEVCPSEVKVDVPDIQVPEVPSVNVMPEASQDPI
jgi:hypothetical protein